MTFTVAKRHRRVWIDCDGEPIYTPPNFVRIPDRAAIACLADAMNAVGRYDIMAIADFEYRYTPNKKRPEHQR